MPSQIDESKIEIVCLTNEYQKDISSFTCGEEPLDTFLNKESLLYQKDNLGITHLFYYDEKLSGFVTLSMHTVKREHIPDEKQPAEEHGSYPALLIGRLAVSTHIRKRGLGKIICQWSYGQALKSLNYIGCKFLVVDAKPKAIDFYRKCGFYTLLKQKGENKTMIKPVIQTETT